MLFRSLAGRGVLGFLKVLAAAADNVADERVMLFEKAGKHLPHASLVWGFEPFPVGAVGGRLVVRHFEGAPENFKVAVLGPRWHRGADPLPHVEVVFRGWFVPHDEGEPVGGSAPVAPHAAEDGLAARLRMSSRSQASTGRNWMGVAVASNMLLVRVDISYRYASKLLGSGFSASRPGPRFWRRALWLSSTMMHSNESVLRSSASAQWKVAREDGTMPTRRGHFLMPSGPMGGYALTAATSGALTERTAPLSASSPTITKFSSWSVSSCSLAVTMPTAIVIILGCRVGQGQAPLLLLAFDRRCGRLGSW